MFEKQRKNIGKSWDFIGVEKIGWNDCRIVNIQRQKFAYSQFRRKSTSKVFPIGIMVAPIKIFFPLTAVIAD